MDEHGNTPFGNDGKRRDEARKRLERAAGSVRSEDVDRAAENGGEKAGGLVDSGRRWVSTLGKRALLLVELLNDWRNGFYPAPWRVIAVITAAILYFLNPFDLIPDVIPVLGLTDDALVVWLAVLICSDDLRSFCASKGYDPAVYGLDDADGEA